MRSSIVVSSLFAALAIASPVHQALHKKAYVYDIVTDIVTVTVTAGQEPEIVKVQKTVFVNPVAATTSKAKVITTKSRKPRPTTTSAAPPPPPTTTTTSSPPPPPPSSTTTTTPVVVFTPEPVPTTTSVVPVVVETTPTPTPTSAPDSSSGDAIRDAAVNYHNEKRALHGAGSLSWDEGLAADAQTLANKCIMDHEIYGSYGQNLASSGDSRPNALDEGSFMEKSAADWYNELDNFKALGLMGLSDIPDTGDKQVLHFTQFVWKATTKIGCAVNYCGLTSNLFDGKFYAYIAVCNYAKAGNVGGQYANNVS